MLVFLIFYEKTTNLKRSFKFMNWEFIIQKLSETSWHIAIMISVVSLLKLFITQWFLVKLAQVKTSKIIVKNNEKSASFSKPEDGDNVIQIFKNSDEINPDIFDKSS
jgi:hypothetical protein